MADNIRLTRETDVACAAEGMIACTLPAVEWTHGAHWAAALWLIARRPDVYPPEDMPGFIRRYNESTGGQNTDASGYHETITQASLRAAHAFLADAANDEALSETLLRLLASPLGRSDWLFAYWSRNSLMSAGARRTWTEPDLAPFPYPPFPLRT